MSGIREFGSAPIFLCELAHKVRAALEEPATRARAQEIVFSVMAQQREENWADTHARIQFRDEVLKWHHNGCQGPKPIQAALPHNTELGVSADDWPLPTELGVEESPGCVFALVAVNEFAAENGELFHRNGQPFTPIWPGITTGPSNVFFLYWTEAVNNIRTEHKELMGRVVQCAIDGLTAADRVPIDLVTVREIAELAGVTEKAIRNRLSEACTDGAQMPKAVQGSIGTAQAKCFSYSELRTLLIQRSPRYADRLPALFAEVELKLAKFR